MKKFFADFKKFIARGNILDLSIAVVVGGAFSAIVTALTNKIITPLINWLIAAITGSSSLEGVYTLLRPAYLDEAGTVIDWAHSIYIDWGAFISAILNFFIIAFVLFLIIKLVMSAQGFATKKIKEWPNRAERKILKADGVDMRDRKQVILATAALREKNKPVVVVKPTTEELLTQILQELKAQNKTTEVEQVTKAIEDKK